jgi:hypothetical protein
MISSTFFFLFSQLSVGMLWALLFISPRVIWSSFFKFSSQTAAILMGVTLGFDFLFPSPVRSDARPFALLLVTAVLAGVYNRMVHIERYRPAMWLLLAAGLTGLASITLDSLAFTRLMELGGWENWVLVANHVAATGLLGAVMLTMVFGHWYLVVPKLSIDPLRTLTQVYLGAIGLRALTLILTLGVLKFQDAAISWSGIATELMVRQGLFFWPRILFGIVAPLVLGGMIWSTVKIRHTQAATGLLYLAVVTLLFGEFFSKFLLWSLSLPL